MLLMLWGQNTNIQLLDSPCHHQIIELISNFFMNTDPQLQRQRAFQTAKRVKLLQDVDQAHFAKETVASILKKAPPVVGHQPVAQSRTPPRTPTREGPHTPERVHFQGPHSLSPRSHRRQCETQVCRQCTDTCFNLLIRAK